MTTLIFLHGIGEGNIEGNWLEALNDALKVMGYSALVGSSVIAPRYVNLLKQEPSPHCPMPKYNTIKPDNIDRERWAYERRQASLEKLLNREAGNGDIFNDIPPKLEKLVLSIVKQAERYVSNEGLRGCILQTVLDQLPIFGEEVVIIGHSLGSLVAIDLLDHLPSRLIVRRLITIGSPAGHVIMHGKGERLLKKFPISQVRSWVNVWSILDPVPFGMGIAQLFPYALDVRINLGMGEHSADKYLADEKVARAVGDGVFTPPPHSIIIRPDDHSIIIRLDDNEKMILASLAYGHFLADSITDPSQKARFLAALGDVQTNVIIRLADLYNSKERPLPEQLASLIDGQRPDLNSPNPMFDLRQSILVILTIASNNVVAPFEIKVSEDERKEALESLAGYMGFTKDRGTVIFEALKTARSIVVPKSGWLWIVLGFTGLGLLLAGPVGLILAAPAGLSGAAAIVSALAAFGPGGMLGGLITAGALVGTGGGTIAMAVAVASASVETLETMVVLQLAIAIASHNLKERRDTGPWYALCGLETEIARELQRLEPYSDKDSPSLKNMQRKQEAVRRALDYMVEKLGYKYETILALQVDSTYNVP